MLINAEKIQILAKQTNVLATKCLPEAENVKLSYK